MNETAPREEKRMRETITSSFSYLCFSKQRKKLKNVSRIQEALLKKRMRERDVDGSDDVDSVDSDRRKGETDSRNIKNVGKYSLTE